MDPYGPFDDPNIYGREYETVERPQPGVYFEDSMWAPDPLRDYQERLFIERMRRDLEAQHYLSQQSWGTVPASAPSPLPVPEAAQPRPEILSPKDPYSRAEFSGLISLEQELARTALEALEAADAPADVVVPERPEKLFFPRGDFSAVPRSSAPTSTTSAAHSPRNRRKARRESVRVEPDYGWRKDKPYEPYIVKDQYGTAMSQPKVAGWKLGDRLPGDSIAIHHTRRESLFGVGHAAASLYLIPAANSIQAAPGLYIGALSPVSSEQVHLYAYDTSVAFLGLNAYDDGEWREGEPQKREQRSIDRLEVEIAQLLGRFGIEA